MVVEKVELSRPIAVVGLLSLTFTAAGCPGTWGDDGFNDEGSYCSYGYYGDCYTTSGSPTEGTSTTTTTPTTDDCATFDCCESYWCDEDDTNYATSYTSDFTTDPPPTSEPTTIPDTDTLATTDTQSTDSDTGTDTLSTDTDTLSTDTDTGTDTGTSTSTGSETGTDSISGTDTDDTDTGGTDAFPPLGEFGDDVTETDLIGTWSLQWAPDGATFDSILTIDDSGNFIWRETSADCSSDTLGTGVVWVEPGQIVMHVETWERQLPWDSLPIMGQEFPPPFRLRMSYVLLGTNLVLAAPDRITEAAPYAGRAYLQSVAEGQYIAGTWNGETELMGLVIGVPQAKVVVRDRFIATLELESNPPTPEGDGVVLHDQTWYGVDPPVAGPDQFEIGNWTCLGGCPQPSGSTLINGNNDYVYGPYAGFQRLATFASGKTFRRDIDTDCP
ncbi:MAG: hypothetical protein JNL82_13890 [Myxococcales bacterium]|nr:hypothetical protein [Myxococcales bacterium]